MIGYGSLISWLLVVGKPASPAADIQPWVMPLHMSQPLSSSSSF